MTTFEQIHHSQTRHLKDESKYDESKATISNFENSYWSSYKTKKTWNFENSEKWKQNCNPKHIQVNITL